MHPFDDTDTALEVIDATLAGEAVEPEHADLAELTLILAGQRPQPSATFADALDERVARRFVTPPAAGARRRPAWRWLYAPGAALAAGVAVALVIVLSAGGSNRPLNGAVDLSATPSLSTSAAAGASTTRATSRPNAVLPRNAKSAPRYVPFGAPHVVGRGSSGSASASAGAALSSSASATSTTPASPVPAPVVPGAPLPLAPSNGARQVIQGAQLALSTRPSHVDSVAQQVFNVIAQQGGVVNNSNVTATNNATGYAQFELSVPSANLGQTMAELSRLHGASVVSRTDATQDVTGQVGGAGRRLAEARALRTALLRMLANATTTTAIDSLKIQIRDANASVASDLATLHSLQHQVDFSIISLTINASMVPGHPLSSGGTFTLGKAAHDAKRVLVVVAGGALIALAVLVPLGMLAAVLVWLGWAIRRRRREQALDLV